MQTKAGSLWSAARPPLSSCGSVSDSQGGGIPGIQVVTCFRYNTVVIIIIIIILGNTRTLALCPRLYTIIRPKIPYLLWKHTNTNDPQHTRTIRNPAAAAAIVLFLHRPNQPAIRLGTPVCGAFVCLRPLNVTNLSGRSLINHAGQLYDNWQRFIGFQTERVNRMRV